ALVSKDGEFLRFRRGLLAWQRGASPRRRVVAPPKREGRNPGRCPLSKDPFTGTTESGAKAVAEQPASADLQQKYRQFLDLLPLTITLAGLPASEGRLFSEEQIEARGITIRAAYRVARTVAKECLGGS